MSHSKYFSTSPSSRALSIDTELDTPQGTQPPNRPASDGPSPGTLREDGVFEPSMEDRASIEAFIDLLDASSGAFATTPSVTRVYDRSQFRFVPVASDPPALEDEETWVFVSHHPQHGEDEGADPERSELSPSVTPHDEAPELLRLDTQALEPADPHARGIRIGVHFADGTRPAAPYANGTSLPPIESEGARSTNTMAGSNDPPSPVDSQEGFEQPTFGSASGLPSYREHLLDDALRRRQRRLDRNVSPNRSPPWSDSGSDPDPEPYPGWPQSSSQEMLPMHED